MLRHILMHSSWQCEYNKGNDRWLLLLCYYLNERQATTLYRVEIADTLLEIPRWACMLELALERQRCDEWEDVDEYHQEGHKPEHYQVALMECRSGLDFTDWETNQKLFHVSR